MNTDWDDLYNVAARLMSPNDIAEGKAKLRLAASQAIEKIRWIKFISIISVAFSLAFFCAFLGGHAFFLVRAVPDQSYKILGITYYYFILPLFLICILFMSIPDLAQFVQPFRSWLKLPKECHPDELASLFNGLRSGDWEAETNKGTVPEYIFSSEWRVLLAAGAEFKERRRWIRYWWRESYAGDIKARRVQLNFDLPTPPLEVHPDQTTKQLDLLPISLSPAKSDRKTKPQAPLLWLLNVREERFEDFLNAVQGQGKWEDENAPNKVRIFLTAAWQFAAAEKRAGKDATIAGTITYCTPILVAQLSKGKLSHETVRVSLAGKGTDKDSTEWMRQILSTYDKYSYSWVKELALQFTTRSSGPANN